jgi:hypothetical protein
MNKQRLGLLIGSVFGAVALHFSTWITKTSFAAGEATEKVIGLHESGMGRQAHLLLLVIGLVALLAPGENKGMLTNSLSDPLSRLGKVTAATLGVALFATCYLSKQINADDPAALLSSYVMEAEGEIGVAEADLKEASEALAAGRSAAEANIAAATAVVPAEGTETEEAELAVVEAKSALTAMETAVSDAELGIEETKAMAEEMRAMTPAQMFDGESYKAAGAGHLIGMLFALLMLLSLIWEWRGTVDFTTEKRWMVGGLGLLASASVLAACQTATVGPMEIGVKALEHPEGKAVQILGLLIAAGVMLVRRKKDFGWIDGLLFTGLLGAMLAASLLHTTDIVLQGTQIPASQLLALVLPAMAIASLWPIAACCKPSTDESEDA